MVDAGAWVTALIDSGVVGDACRLVLSDDEDWAAPTHAPVEALRTIRRYESAGLISAEQADAYAATVHEAEVRYMGPEPWLLSFVWGHRHNISPYDAPYVAIAARYGVSFVTLDRRLAAAATAVGVHVLVPS